MKDTTTNRLTNILKTKKSFAVIQFFTSLISTKSETTKEYEIMYINAKKVKFAKLSYSQFAYIKNEIKDLKLVVDDNGGRVWDFNNFKEKYNNLPVLIKAQFSKEFEFEKSNVK
jgi:hypothetical protein